MFSNCFVASSTRTNMKSSGSRREPQLRRPLQPAAPRHAKPQKGESPRTFPKPLPGEKHKPKPKLRVEKTLWYCHDISLRWCICLDRAKNSSAHHLRGFSQSPLASQKIHKTGDGTDIYITFVCETHQGEFSRTRSPNHAKQRPTRSSQE